MPLPLGYLSILAGLFIVIAILIAGAFVLVGRARRDRELDEARRYAQLNDMAAVLRDTLNANGPQTWTLDEAGALGDTYIMTRSVRGSRLPNGEGAPRPRRR